MEQKKNTLSELNKAKNIVNQMGSPSKKKKTFFFFVPKILDIVKCYNT